jgi:hypothetical protein
MTRVTLRGEAVTGAAGAMINAERGPVYIEGLAEWPDGLEGRTVEAAGVLRHRPSRVPEGAPHVHGVDERDVLEDASWRAFT